MPNKTEPSYDELSLGKWSVTYKAAYDFMGYMKWDEAIEMIKSLKAMQSEFETAISTLTTKGEKKNENL